MTKKLTSSPIQINTCAICVPIVGPTVEDILSQVQEAVQAKVDLIELRPDMWMKGSHLHEEEYIPTIVNLVEEVHSRYEKMSILFTWRTLAEGGETKITVTYYKQLWIKI